MIPSQKWFPTSLAARAAWFQNFAAQFAVAAADLGLTGEAAQVESDNAVIQFLADADVQVNAYGDAVRQFRKIITENAVGTPTPAFPDAPTTTLPDTVILSTGIFERLNRLVERIKVAPGYTNETGALLGIYVAPAQKTNTPEQEASMQPDLKCAALPAAAVEIRFVRGRSDGISVQFQRAGSEEWLTLGNFFQSPVVVNVPLAAPNQPEQISIRARYIKGNSPVGIFSKISQVVVAP